jgi:FKBP12-rapamycin complex-associated protein
LTLLVGAAQRLIKPYALPMLKVILPKARDPNAAVASSVLACLGELARVGGEDLTPHLPDMIKLVIEMLQDQTSLVRRDAALRTLGQLCSSTSYVITPLIEYPQLLPILVKILKADQTTSIRRETIKVMGILGALDPYRHKVHHDIPATMFGD